MRAMDLKCYMTKKLRGCNNDLLPLSVQQEHEWNDHHSFYKSSCCIQPTCYFFMLKRWKLGNERKLVNHSPRHIQLSENHRNSPKCNQNENEH